MDIQKEIEISKHQPVVFYEGSELGNLYKAIIEYFKVQEIDAFATSTFYNLGRIHGIREERARRKQKTT